MLSEGIARLPGRTTALLHRDAVNGRVKGRRGARLAALTGGGAIPDSSQYTVVAEPEGLPVGQVDEDFAVESVAGDVFLLGNTSWRIRRIETGTVRVEDAHGEAPGIPFWNAEAPGRSRELSAEVSELREELERRLDDRGSGRALARGGVRRPRRRRAPGRRVPGREPRACSARSPRSGRLVAERFFDEAGGMQLVLHAPFGARTNRALGLALRKRFCRRFDFELQAAATDEGVLLSLGPQHSFPLESVFELVSESTVDEVLAQAAIQAPMFGVRWRWNATRALAIPRLFKGKRMPAQIARMRSDDLLAAVFPAQVACQDNAPVGPIELPDHPLVSETLRDCLCDAMDAPGLKEVLRAIAGGEIRLLAVDTAEPSPMSHEILGARPWAYLDDAPLEERRARAVAVRRALPAAEADGLGALDPGAIAEVAEQVWPVVRDPDELHDALLDLGILPASDGGRAAELLAPLVEGGRAARLRFGGGEWWVAAERVGLARAVGPALETSVHPERSAAAGGAESKGVALPPATPTLAPELVPLPSERLPEDDDAAALAVVRGWVPRVGPFAADGLAARIGLAPERVAAALARLEAEGLVLRGRFLPGAPESGGAPHWCERSVLARIHRLTIGRLRKEIEPASAADLLRFLARWQHVAAGTRLHGARGLAEVIGQLQGFHAAAGAWERELLAARIVGYERGHLDELCLGRRGRVGAARRHRRAGGGAATAQRPDPQRAGDARPARGPPVAARLAAGPPPPLGPSARALVDAARAAGRLVPARPGRGDRPAPRRGRAGALGARLRRLRDLRRLLRPPRPHRAGTPRADPRAAPGSSGAAGRSCARRRSRRPAPPAEEGASLGRLAGQYLRRYGVVFRDLLAREAAPPPWRELLREYRALEARGAIRGGRFVAGFTGEQFALPEAVDALRAVRRAPRERRRARGGLRPRIPEPRRHPHARRARPRGAGEPRGFVDGVPVEADDRARARARARPEAALRGAAGAGQLRLLRAHL